MNHTPSHDQVLARRRLRRQLGLWRIAAVLAVFAALYAGIPWPGNFFQSDHIALVRITGTIYPDPARMSTLTKLRENDKARAVIVHIDSPGGTVGASEALYREISRISAEKTTVAVIGDSGASGGYITALATDRIFALETSITGSIGVVGQAPDASALLDKLGVTVTEIKSSPLKAAPSLVASHQPNQIEAAAETIEDSFAWFKAIVKERRDMNDDALEEVADGRTFIGNTALSKGLIDAIGGEFEAVEWLKANADIDSDAKVKEYRYAAADNSPLKSIFGSLLGSFDLGISTELPSLQYKTWAIAR